MAAKMGIKMPGDLLTWFLPFTRRLQQQTSTCNCFSALSYTAKLHSQRRGRISSNWLVCLGLNIHITSHFVVYITFCLIKYICLVGQARDILTLEWLDFLFRWSVPAFRLFRHSALDCCASISTHKLAENLSCKSCVKPV